jgi:hypothetical protein
MSIDVVARLANDELGDCRRCRRAAPGRQNRIGISAMLYDQV